MALWVKALVRYIQHSNHLKKAGVYNGQNVVINMTTKARTLFNNVKKIPHYRRWRYLVYH